MNYIFRPTPVMSLKGIDRAVDRATLKKPPAGIMHGWPIMRGGPSRSFALQGDPWLIRSGSMASFGTLGHAPLGRLGQDDDDSDFTDFSSTLSTPISSPGDFSVVPDGSFIDTTGAFSTPIIPTTSTLDLTAPNFSTPISPVSPIQTAADAAPVAPTGGAGATGQSIPGTQPVNAAQTSAWTSLLNAVTNVISPKKTGTVLTPGVGVNPNTASASTNFLAASTILPGTPNGTVLVGGLVVLGVLAVVLGKK